MSPFSFGQYGKWTELHPTIKGNYPNNIFPNRWEFGMTQLTDKKVLLFGGEVEYGDNGFFANETWIYDYDENSWTQIITKNTPSPREGHSIAQISDGKVLLFGGYYNNLMSPPNDTNIILNDTWIFDIADTNWHEIKVEHSPGKRTRHGMAQLYDGSVFLFGGSPDHISFLNSSYIFDLQTLTWNIVSVINTKPISRASFGIAKIQDGEIIIYGGWCSKYLNDTWIYRSLNNNWNEIINSNLTAILKNQPIANLTDEYLLMYGGTGGHWDSTWIYITKNSKWFQPDNFIKPEGRYMHNMAKITNGKALMTSGISDLGTMNDTWLFELDSNFIDVQEIKDNHPELKTFINSNNELILDYFITENEQAHIEIFNLQSICIYSEENIQVLSGWNRKIIPIDFLPAGVYFVKVRAGTELFVEKFVKY